MSVSFTARMMALPEAVRSTAVGELDAFCKRRDAGVPREQMRLDYEFRGDAVILVERRIPWNPASEGDPWTRTPIARFRYDPASRQWTLYWPDRNSRWHLDTRSEPSHHLGPLLIEVDRDPTGIYWG